MTLTTERRLATPPPPAGPVEMPPTGPTDDVWVIEPRGHSLKSRVAELWRYRGLFRYFAVQSIQGMYARTFIGKSWLFLRPIIPLAISTLFFHSLIGIQTGGTPYFLFLLISTSIWELCERTALTSMRSMFAGRRLLRKLYFPRIILPLSFTAAPLAILGVHLLLVVPVTIYFWVTGGRFPLALGPNTLLCLPAVLLSLLCGLVIGLPCSVIGSEKRDLRFGVRTMFRFWFFLTPVVYPLSLMQGKMRVLAIVNPMTPAVELFRQGLLGTTDDLSILGPAIACSLVVLAVGLTFSVWFFLRAEAAAVDRV